MITYIIASAVVIVGFVIYFKFKKKKISNIVESLQPMNVDIPTPLVKETVRGEVSEVLPEKSLTPPSARPEIITIFDYVKKNIQYFDINLQSSGFEYFNISPREESDINQIVVSNNYLKVNELNSSFTLFPKEIELFYNLAKEESDRRELENTKIIYEKLKKYADKLSRNSVTPIIKNISKNKTRKKIIAQATKIKKSK